jgi:hypothetical protein
VKARFDAGTDVAMIGAWDAQRGAQPFTAEENKALSNTLDAEADGGHIFVLHTGADGGGPVDVYIDEPVPADVLARLTPLDGEFIVAVPSGTLVVDGVEFYRGKKPDSRRADRTATVPPGDYALRCYTAKDEEEAAARVERNLESVVGAEDLRYYERVNRLGCITGLLLLLLFPLLAPFVGVKWALSITAVVVLGFFHVRERILKRNARFAQLSDRIMAFRLNQQEPTFVLELRRVDDRGGLTGGSVSLT